MLIDIYMKFHEESKMVFKLLSRHDFVEDNIQVKNSRSINARVVVLVICLSSNVD